MNDGGFTTPQLTSPGLPPVVPSRPAPFAHEHVWAVRATATRTMLCSILVVGVLTDVVFHTGFATLSAFATFCVTTVLLLRSGRLENRTAKALALGSVAFSIWLVLRTSAWLIVLDICAASAMLIASSSFARSRAPWTTSIPEFVRRAFAVVAHGFGSVAFVLSAIKSQPRGRIAPIVRGVVLALPLLLILGALLASADAVFASFFDVDVDNGAAIVHLFGIVVGCAAMASLLRIASAAHEPQPIAGHRTLRHVEMIVLLGLLDVLFGLWALAQLLAMSSAGDHVLKTQGLSYAQYARTGFFQLLAVAGITISIVLSVRAALRDDEPNSKRWFSRLVLVLLALTLAIVAVSIQRLSLYEREFGWTSLRLVVHISAFAIGALVILLALSCTSRFGARNWFPSAGVVVACLALLFVNVLNPDDFVTRHNVLRAPTTARALDGGYLAQLSDDAIPAAVHGLDSLSHDERVGLVWLLCQRRYTDPDWLHWNLSARNADAAIRSLQCPK